MKKGLIIGLIVLVGCAQTIETDVGESEAQRQKYYWSVRLIFYNDDAMGQATAENMVKWLKNKGVEDVFYRTTTIQNRPIIAVYSGKFEAEKLAVEARNNFRRLHTAFGHCDIVKLLVEDEKK